MSILDTVQSGSYYSDKRYLYIADKFGVSPLQESCALRDLYVRLYRIFGRFVRPTEMSNIAFVTVWDDRFTVVSHNVEYIETINERASMYACSSQNDIFTREYQNVDFIGPDVDIRHKDGDEWRAYYAEGQHIATAEFWVAELDDEESYRDT
jgi:hypothetical protein